MINISNYSENFNVYRKMCVIIITIIKKKEMKVLKRWSKSWMYVV